MKILKILTISLILLLSSNTLIAAELKKVEGDVTSPALKLENLKGKKLDLVDYKGKVVLVQFWATYCTPCRVEMPSMNKLMANLKESKIPFEILAVNMAETADEIQKFVDEVKPEFTILKGVEANMLEWNVFAAPSNFLIGPKGKIRYTLYGGVEWDSETITKVIKELASEISSEKDLSEELPKEQPSKQKS